MAKLPWFPFYPADWLSSSKTAIMTKEQKSGYLDLLCHEWADQDCTLPDDDYILEKLSGLSNWHLHKKVIRSCFKPHPTIPGRLINERLFQIRREQEAAHSRRVEAGSKGNAIRWGSQCDGNATELGSQSESESESESDSSSKTQKRKDRNPKKDSSPEQPTADSVAAIPAALQGLRLYETDRKLIERLPELLVEWGGAYPGVQILWEIKKAHAWESSHPKRRKKNHISFLNNWLSRAQNEASRTVRGTPFVPTVEDPNRSNCPHCGGTKELAGGVENGRITRIPCRYCSPVEIPENRELKAKGENLISETLGKAFRKANP